MHVHWSVSLSVDKYVWAIFLYRLRHLNCSCNLAVTYSMTVCRMQEWLPILSYSLNYLP